MNPGADAAALAAPGSVNARTVAGARRSMAAKLRARGIESPELDARILIGHALGLDHAALAAAHARMLDAEEENAIAALAHRRLAREPVARIVGSKEFWSLKLRVDAATLVPRPETETIVEAALAAIDARGPRSRALRIADLGTGCGAIILALLSELPNAFGDRQRREHSGRSGCARQCPPSWIGTRGIPRLRHGGGVARTIRRHRLQSAIHRVRRHRRARPRGARFRPARARSTADPTGSTSIGRLRLRRPPCWRPAAH